jgi:hypothetical protein
MYRSDSFFFLVSALGIFYFLFIYLFIFCGTGDQTQGFMLARQCFFVFFETESQYIDQQTLNL